MSASLAALTTAVAVHAVVLANTVGVPHYHAGDVHEVDHGSLVLIGVAWCETDD
jgi:hypothetical protein